MEAKSKEYGLVGASDLVRCFYYAKIPVRYRTGKEERIKNPTAYMLTLLYNAKEQMNFDISNQVQHDMYHWEPPTE